MTNKKEECGKETPEFSDGKLNHLINVTNEADEFLKFLLSGGSPSSYIKK